MEGRKPWRKQPEGVGAGEETSQEAGSQTCGAPVKQALLVPPPTSSLAARTALVPPSLGVASPVAVPAIIFLYAEVCPSPLCREHWDGVRFP